MKPNVVLLTVDCLRYDRCGFDGHWARTTPTLDSLSNVHVYDSAYASGPHTSESLPGILAGRYSHQCPYFDDVKWKAIPPSRPTIAEAVSEQGYSTFASITNPHLISERNFDRGFDAFTNLRAELRGDKSGVTVGGESTSLTGAIQDRIRDLLYASRRVLRSDGGAVQKAAVPTYLAYRYYQYYSGWPQIDADRVVDELIAEIEDHDSPFFGWAHFMDLHGPLNPAAIRQTDLAPSGSTYRYFRWDLNRASNVNEPYYNRMYDAALRFVDAQIARLIEHLKETGLYEDTVIVVTADHGEALHDRGSYGHLRHYVYDHALHVPLLVRAPDIDTDRREQPVSLCNLHELLPEYLPGVDGPLLEPNPVDEHLPESAVLADALSDAGHTVAVRGDGYKLISHEGNLEETPYADARTAYRVSSDPTERHEIDPGEVPESFYEVVDRVTTAPEELRPHTGSMTEDLEKQLQHLGYKA